LIKKKKMKKPIAMLMTAIMILSITVSALPLSAYAATDDNLYGGGVDDIKAPQLAPLNPDFVAYKENPPEIFYGYIPPPMDLSHLDQIPVVGLPTLDKLPSSFDWRDYGKVTPVKDQNPCGTCWTFGTTSVLESAVLIGESVEYDFSEQSVALCVDHSWYYLYDGPTDPCNGGGWSWMASEVFIKKGSVQESCNPYDTSALNCDGSCVCDDCPTVKKVEGYRLATNDGSQLDVIKNAVYNQGPVTVAYYHDFGEYWDPTWGPIYDYYPCSDYVNHMISIIGWDDDVPHPNPGHTGTGAWIVKNSWGTADSWADGAGVSDGYFYLAYDSSCANEIAYLEYKDPVSGEKLLYWDEAGFVNSVGYSDNSAWMANVFTAHGSGDLTHVDFWTTSNNAQYEVYVWNGFFGIPLAHQTGTCQEYGYYSIPLSAPISIDVGQQFTVGVDMTTPGFNYPIPVEYEIPGDVDPPIQTDVSFIRHTDSASWTDLADYDWNACLRARMVSEEEKPDLVITDKWMCWPDNCTICYNVTNIGDGTAPACHNTTLYVDGVEVAHDHAPVPLAPGESYIGWFDDYTWRYTPPSDDITVCADNNETIDELDEDNNCLTNMWMCGDVNCDGKVTMSDVRKVFNRYLDPSYPLDLPWAADVNCDGKVTMSDVRKVFNRYLDQGYELNCCCEV
jgi:C1A family cysteine protease